MPLSSGARLGPYEIQAAIGAGGMGEVYKARDTRLDRTVAIKVLPAELNTDAERRARFAREAKTIAGLSHPHICTLYDVGEHNGSTYLVMEHLQGDTLADRLLRGRMPLEQALGVATEIADALAAAHRQGIIHRDLKPGNVMLTKAGAKLLDFGLAKALAPARASATADAMNSPTRSAPLTAEGTIVGTLQYMAPEQLEGKEADARTDLWALGVILYEMVTGKRAFEGNSAVNLMAAILEHEPSPITSLQPLTPPALDSFVRRCLAKAADDRPDTAHDVADELRSMRDASGIAAPAISSPRRLRARMIGWAAIFGIAGALVGAGALWLFQPTRADPVRPMHVSLDVRPADELTSGAFSFVLTPGGAYTALAWTPDGRRLVFVGRRQGIRHLYVRAVDGDEARPIPGTEGAQAVAVSPDGRWVAFWAATGMKKAPLAEGPTTDLLRDLPPLPERPAGPATRAAGWRSSLAFPPMGVAFDDRGNLFIGGRDRGIGMVPAVGDPRWVTTPREGEVVHGLPHPLPGGRVILYTVRRSAIVAEDQIVAETLATGERKVVLTNASDARYLGTGHLVFVRAAKLFAVPFDAERLERRGEEVPVVDAVAQTVTAGFMDLTRAGQYAISPSGDLAWVAGGVVPFPDRALVSVDLQGRVTALTAPLRFYAPGIGLSPDGRRLAVTVLSHGEAGMWSVDLASGRLDSLVLEGVADTPKWTPDGRGLAFFWQRGGRLSLGMLRVDGSSPADVLELADAQGNPPPKSHRLSSWSPDGRELALVLESDLAVARVEGSRATFRVLAETPHSEQSPEFSPDGRWLAYSSDESRRQEIYVQPYPGPGLRTRVSIEGGTCPAWSGDGRQLFFLEAPDASGRGRMMVADFDPASPTRTGTPRRLFEFGPDLLFPSAPARSHVVAPDGQRFYVVQRLPDPPRPPVTHVNLILNWFEELTAKVPPTR